jgi:hypothetical protein
MLDLNEFIVRDLGAENAIGVDTAGQLVKIPIPRTARDDFGTSGRRAPASAGAGCCGIAPRASGRGLGFGAVVPAAGRAGQERARRRRRRRTPTLTSLSPPSR